MNGRGAGAGVGDGGAALLERVWHQLGAARRFHRSVLHHRAAAPDAIGEGRVIVEEHDLSELLQAEAGHCTFGGTRRVACRNSWRWRFEREHGALHLAHLRHGRTRPVELVTLLPASAPTPTDGLLHSSAPHQCGADRYTLEIEIEERALLMRWHIRGPHKNHWLHVRYERDDAPAAELV